jgi:hypothetical protein
MRDFFCTCKIMIVHIIAEIFSDTISYENTFSYLENSVSPKKMRCRSGDVTICKIFFTILTWSHLDLIRIPLMRKNFPKRYHHLSPYFLSLYDIFFVSDILFFIFTWKIRYSDRRSRMSTVLVFFVWKRKNSIFHPPLMRKRMGITSLLNWKNCKKNILYSLTTL